MPFTNISLAIWQLRRSWSLLLITGVGILAAVTLVCSAPLYTQAATTSSLRNTLSTTSPVLISATLPSIPLSDFAQLTTTIDQRAHQHLGTYISSSQFVIGPGDVRPFQSQRAPDQPFNHWKGLDYEMGVLGYPMDQTASHLRLIEGRLPSDQLLSVEHQKMTIPVFDFVKARDVPAVVINNVFTIEVAFTQETAQLLKLQSGSVILLPQSSTAAIIPGHGINTLRLVVTGIFDTPDSHQMFWHDTSLKSYTLHPASDMGVGYTGLVSNKALLAAYSQFGYDGFSSRIQPQYPFYWYYPLNPATISSSDQDTLLQGLRDFQTQNEQNSPFKNRFTQHSFVSSPLDFLTQTHSQLDVALVPVGGLLLIIYALILYFVSLMTELLIERQDVALALLRSRGASRQQLVSSFALQSLSLGLLALLLAPLLAVQVARACWRSVYCLHPISPALTLCSIIRCWCCIFWAGMRWALQFWLYWLCWSLFYV